MEREARFRGIGIKTREKAKKSGLPKKHFEMVKRIDDLLDERGWLPVDLKDRGFPYYNKISSFRTGKQNLLTSNLNTIVSLCEALGVSLDYLYYGDDSRDNKDQ